MTARDILNRAVSIVSGTAKGKVRENIPGRVLLERMRDGNYSAELAGQSKPNITAVLSAGAFAVGKPFAGTMPETFSGWFPYDIDHAPEKGKNVETLATAELRAEARKKVETLGSVIAAKVSTSGTGLHVWQSARSF